MGRLGFMAAAASRGYHVLQTRGDSLAYDIVIEQHGGLRRVQVKSRSARNGARYFCQFPRKLSQPASHTLDNLDILATSLLVRGNSPMSAQAL
jgi:hypothetical protein